MSVKVIELSAGVTVVDPAAVTRPLAFTVKVPAAVALPYDPTFELTVASVPPAVTFTLPSKFPLDHATSPVIAMVRAVCSAVAVPALPVMVVWSPVLLPLTLTAPAPIVRTEVLAPFPVNVTVPVLTVRAVVNVALVTVAAFPVHEPDDPVTFPVTLPEKVEERTPVEELNVRLALVFGPTSPAAAVKNET
jgi:hypothetical protein